MHKPYNIDYLIVSCSVFIRDEGLDNFQLDPLYESDGMIEYKAHFKVNYPTADFYIEGSTNPGPSGIYSVQHEYNYFSDDYELLMGDLTSRVISEDWANASTTVLPKQTILNTIHQDLPSLTDLYWHPVLWQQWGYNQPLTGPTELFQPYRSFTSLNLQYDVAKYNDLSLLSRQYFINWSRDYTEVFETAVDSDIDDGHQRDHWIFTRERTRNMLTYSDNKVETFPMHARISFPNSPQNAQVSEIVFGSGMQEWFCTLFRNQQVYNQSRTSVIKNNYLNVANPTLQNQYSAYRDLTGEAQYISNASIGDLEVLPTLLTPLKLPYEQRRIILTSDSNITDGGNLNMMLLENVLSSALSNANSMMTNYTQTSSNSTSACSTMMQALNATNLINSIQTYLSDKLMSGYSETLMFRVDKKLASAPDRQISDDTDPVITSWWFFNSDELETLEVLDTQILYGETYIYECFIYVLCEAEYTNYSLGNLLDVNYYDTSLGGDFPSNSNSVTLTATPQPNTSEDNNLENDYLNPKYILDLPNSHHPSAITDSNRPHFSKWAIIEVPYFHEEVQIIDSPPITPDVEIVGYRGVSDKILMMFNSQVNQKLARPIVILEEDEDKFMEQIRNQQAYGDRLALVPSYQQSTSYNTYIGVSQVAYGLALALSNIFGGPQPSPPSPSFAQYVHFMINGGATNVQDLANTILFETDDPPLYIQSFRLRVHPTEYKDFANGRITDIPCFINNPVPNPLKPYRYFYSTSYEDDLEPNVKYYYCFRAIDIHGYISNPSSVYEIEMFKENETIYLKQRIVDMAPKVRFDKIKSFKQYIKISPAVQQNQIPQQLLTDSSFTSANDFVPANSNGYVAMPIGTRPKVLWDYDGSTNEKKRFKFRITSKQTGKSFDIDTKFTNNGIIINNEEE